MGSDQPSSKKSEEQTQFDVQKDIVIPGLDLLNKDSNQERNSERSQNGLKQTAISQKSNTEHVQSPQQHSQRTRPPSPPPQQETGVNNIVERYLKNAQMRQTDPPPRKGPKTPPEEEEYDPAAPIDDSEEYDPAIPITDSEDYDPAVGTTDEDYGKRRSDPMETEEDDDRGMFEEAPREDLMERIAKMRGLFGQSDEGMGYERGKHRHR